MKYDIWKPKKFIREKWTPPENGLFKKEFYNTEGFYSIETLYRLRDFIWHCRGLDLTHDLFVFDKRALQTAAELLIDENDDEEVIKEIVGWEYEENINIKNWKKHTILIEEGVLPWKVVMTPDVEWYFKGKYHYQGKIHITNQERNIMAMFLKGYIEFTAWKRGKLKTQLFYKIIDHKDAKGAIDFPQIETNIKNQFMIGQKSSDSKRSFQNLYAWLVAESIADIKYRKIKPTNLLVCSDTSNKLCIRTNNLLIDCYKKQPRCSDCPYLSDEFENDPFKYDPCLCFNRINETIHAVYVNFENWQRYIHREQNDGIKKKEAEKELVNNMTDNRKLNNQKTNNMLIRINRYGKHSLNVNDRKYLDEQCERSEKIKLFTQLAQSNFIVRHGRYDSEHIDYLANEYAADRLNSILEKKFMFRNQLKQINTLYNEIEKTYRNEALKEQLLSFLKLDIDLLGLLSSSKDKVESLITYIVNNNDPHYIPALGKEDETDISSSPFIMTGLLEPPVIIEWSGGEYDMEFDLTIIEISKNKLTVILENHKCLENRYMIEQAFKADCYYEWQVFYDQKKHANGIFWLINEELKQSYKLESDTIENDVEMMLLNINCGLYQNVFDVLKRNAADENNPLIKRIKAELYRKAFEKANSLNKQNLARILRSKLNREFANVIGDRDLCQKSGLID